MTTIHRNPKQDGARIGIIVPSVNTTTETDFNWLAPPRMSFHAARIEFTENTERDLKRMNAQVTQAAGLLETLSPDVVAYACTSGSFFKGIGGSLALEREIGSVVSCPVVTTSGAMIEALISIGARNVALATPYREDITEIERGYLVSQGFEVVSTACLSLSGSMIHKTSPEAIIDLAASVDHPAADAIFISCTDLRALEVIDALETQLGKPVLSSNQVTFWGILRQLSTNYPLDGFGQLLQRVSAPETRA